MYALKNYPRRPRVFVRVGRTLPPDKTASREDLRDRIAAAWRELFEAMIRDYAIRPEELPQSAQERWGEPPPPPEDDLKNFQPQKNAESSEKMTKNGERRIP